MKSSFYLKHDLDARGDDKTRALLMKKGATGYGIYWMVVEDLYKNDGRLVRDYSALSWDYRQPEKEIKSVVEDFGLFYDASGKIACRRVDQERAERAEAVEAARRGGKARSAQRQLSSSSAIPQVGEERRGEEGENITAAPSAAELSTTVDNLCVSKNFDVERLPFKHGDLPKDILIVDMDAKSCQSVLDKHKNLGFKLERALRSQINMKKLECAK